VLNKEGIGCIAFSPLAQGLLTNRYLSGIPLDSRAAKSTSPFLTKEDITPEKIRKITRLNEHAKERGQSLAQMSIAWLLKDIRVTSILVGASNAKQITENADSIKKITFSEDELKLIDSILNDQLP
jgi:L-glyceraldehyde 3-phosphate reductase